MAVQSMVSEAVCQGVPPIIVSALPLTSHLTLTSLYLSFPTFNLELDISSFSSWDELGQFLPLCWK